MLCTVQIKRMLKCIDLIKDSCQPPGRFFREVQKKPHLQSLKVQIHPGIANSADDDTILEIK